VRRGTNIFKAIVLGARACDETDEPRQSLPNRNSWKHWVRQHRNSCQP
jgi:hypothetical protein